MTFLLLYQFLSMKLASVNPMFYDFGMDLEGLMLRPEVKKLWKIYLFLAYISISRIFSIYL